MNTNTAATVTATSTYDRVLDVTISDKGTVYTTTGVFLGDVEGMEAQGWEFA